LETSFHAVSDVDAVAKKYIHTTVGSIETGQGKGRDLMKSQGKVRVRTVTFG